jgi:hypothetical protein
MYKHPQIDIFKRSAHIRTPKPNLKTSRVAIVYLTLNGRPETLLQSNPATHTYCVLHLHACRLIRLEES